MRTWRTFAGVCWTGKRFDFDGGAQEVLGRGRNPPVTALPCQPPLGKGAKGAGVRIAAAVNRSLVRNDTVFARSAVQGRRADRGVRPYGGQQETLWSGASGTPPPTNGTGGTDCHSQCAHWLRNDTLQVVRWGGPMWASAPTEGLQGVRYGGPMWGAN